MSRVRDQLAYLLEPRTSAAPTPPENLNNLCGVRTTQAQSVAPLRPELFLAGHMVVGQRARLRRLSRYDDAVMRSHFWIWHSQTMDVRRRRPPVELRTFSYSGSWTSGTHSSDDMVDDDSYFMFSYRDDPEPAGG